MEERGWISSGIATGIIGSFYEFVPRKSIESITKFLVFDISVLGHRIRQNDMILFGAVMLIISFVSFYKVYKLHGKASKGKNKNQ